jgi:hypothetical protein
MRMRWLAGFAGRAIATLALLWTCAGPTSAWISSIGGDALSGDRAVAVRLDSAGDAVAAGSVVDQFPVQEDFVVAKFQGADGQLVWRFEFDDQGGSVANDLAIDQDDDVLAVGRSGQGQLVAVKLSGASGAVAWRVDLSGTQSFGGQAFEIVADSAGDAFVVGRATNLTTGPDAVVVKLSGIDGSVLWRRDFDIGDAPPFDGDSAQQVVLDPAGNPIATLTSGKRLVVRKLAGATGADVWTLDLGSSSIHAESPLDAVATSSGDVVVVGRLSRPADPGNSTFLVRRVDGATGTLLWTYETDGTATSAILDEARSVAVGADGSILAAGWLGKRPNDVYWTVVQLDGASGAESWRVLERGTPTPKDLVNWANAVTIDSQGSVVAGGMLLFRTSWLDAAVQKRDPQGGGLVWQHTRSGSADSVTEMVLGLAVDGADDVVACGTIATASAGDEFVVFKMQGGSGADF